MKNRYGSVQSFAIRTSARKLNIPQFFAALTLYLFVATRSCGVIAGPNVADVFELFTGPIKGPRRTHGDDYFPRVRRHLDRINPRSQIKRNSLGLAMPTGKIAPWNFNVADGRQQILLLGDKFFRFNMNRI